MLQVHHYLCLYVPSFFASMCCILFLTILFWKKHTYEFCLNPYSSFSTWIKKWGPLNLCFALFESCFCKHKTIVGSLSFKTTQNKASPLKLHVHAVQAAGLDLIQALTGSIIWAVLTTSRPCLLQMVGTLPYCFGWLETSNLG